MRMWLNALIVLCSVTSAVWGQSLDLDEWVRTQLKTENPDRIEIIETKLWPNSPQPNTYVILGVGMKAPAAPDPRFSFVYENRNMFVMLAQSATSSEPSDPKMLSYLVFRSGIGLPGINSEYRPTSIDAGPFQIRKNEYAFGVRDLTTELVGNKGGAAYEVLRLFRYQNSTVKEIFADVTWAYEKYSTGPPLYQSCNLETTIVPELPEQGEFFTLTRKYSRSYFRDSANPQFRNYPTLPEAPTEPCPHFKKLHTPSRHTWNSAQGRYLDSSKRPLDDDFAGKGIFYN